jgi:ElaB/YqjD/DUF883 family membrane-anchored ribosome-binding protein
MATSERSAMWNGSPGDRIGSPVSDADLQTLRDDVARLTQQITGLLAAAGEGTLDELRAQMQQARQNIDGLMTDARAKGRGAAEAVREATDPVVKDVEETVHNHPFVALAVAVGLGIALGAVLRR